MYVFRELTDLSYPAIARLFGGRDHTTVIHAVEKIQRLMKERKQIYDQVTDLVQRLKTGVSRRSRHLWTTWTSWTDRHRRGQHRRCPPNHTVSFPGCGRRGHTWGRIPTPYAGANDGLSTIHSPYYRYYL